MSAQMLPNVVLLTWHDAGDWFGCYGHKTVQTPHVDRLAAEGVRFTESFSACAICSPSRAAIMTGRFCQNNGVMSLTNTVFQNRIHPDIPHLGARLKKLGYRSALFGVQHECAHEHVHEVIQPDEQFATQPWPNGDLLKEYVHRWISDRAGDNQPFYAQIGTFDAHLGRFFTDQPPREDEHYPPVQDTTAGLATTPYLEGSEADTACIGTLQGQLHRGDRVIGAVLDALAEAGLAENTLVIMCVDHGVGLSRAKTTCYDAGTRVGWIMRWPGQIPPGREVSAMSTHVDVLPTVWDLLGQETLPGMDGISLADHVRGSTDEEVHDAVFSHMVEATRSIRTRRFRLVRNFRLPRVPVGQKGDCAQLHHGFENPFEMPDNETATPSDEFPLLELYDLEKDPHELHNVAKDSRYATELASLNDRLWRFLFDQDDFIIHDMINTPWQRATRADLESWCQQTGTKPPHPEGTLGNPIDAATRLGTVA